MGATAVYLEIGTRRVFACALDWPGWCRSGKDEELALEALASYAPRYAAAVDPVRVRFPVTAGHAFDVVERLTGNATTDFGAPGVVPAADHRRLTAAQADRLARLVDASWRVFDAVVADAPASLRKGPRGGGRDRDAIADHVVAAEAAYARKLGLRLKEPVPRPAILDALRAARAVDAGDSAWPAPYAARRIAWHVLDHAWEIEDRRQ